MADIQQTGTTAASADGTNLAGAQSSGQPAEPAILDVDDNALIRVKGSEKPVKFGDHVRGFQAQFTKASQRAAALEKALRERDARLQQFEADRQRGSQAGAGNQGNDVFDALRQLPYLSGADAVEVVQSIGEQIRQRDLVLLGALKQMKQMQDLVQGLHSTSTNTAFDAKIARWLTDGGFPPEAADLAKEIYLAYEGDDLDDEFPKIFADRWNQIEKITEARRQGKITAARRAPFLPGKGGQTGPSKPLEIKPNATSKEVAEQLWNPDWAHGGEQPGT